MAATRTMRTRANDTSLSQRQYMQQISTKCSHGPLLKQSGHNNLPKQHNPKQTLMYTPTDHINYMYINSYICLYV